MDAAKAAAAVNASSSQTIAGPGAISSTNPTFPEASARATSEATPDSLMPESRPQPASPLIIGRRLRC